MLIFPFVTEIPAAQTDAPGLRDRAGAARLSRITWTCPHPDILALFNRAVSPVAVPPPAPSSSLRLTAYGNRELPHVKSSDLSFVAQSNGAASVLGSE